MNAGTLFFSFTGRINRARWWIALLVFVVIGLVMAILQQVAEEDSFAFGALSLIVNIALFISGLAVGAKRLHDRGKSGWWLLLYYIVPSILSGIGLLSFFYGIGADSGSAVIVGTLSSIIAFVILVWVFIELGCLRGTVGPNQYGADPLAAQPAAH